MAYYSKNNKSKIRSSLNKTILIVIGTFSVVLGIIGIFLPILPTTPFLLLAAACYARSSQKFYYWILNNRWFGNYIKNYREGKGISFRIKLFSISFLWITILYSTIYVVHVVVVKFILILVAVGVTIHILSIRTLKQ